MHLRYLLFGALSFASLIAVHAAPQAAKTPSADTKSTEAKSSVKKSSATKSADAKKTETESSDTKSDETSTGSFPELFGTWKLIIAKLHQLKNRYQRDPSADKKAIEAEYTELIKQANTIAEPLRAAAKTAYLADPNQDKALSDFMVQTLTGFVIGDEYEKAAEWARMLLDNKLEHKDLNVLAGMAFFASNDFEDAGKYLQMAKDAKAITPNGERYLRLVDKYKELWAKEQAIRAAEDKANNLPKVKLTTSKGDIVVVLFENEAPIATANFINLVEKKYYDGLKFHRVLPGFMAQGGDPKGDGTGGPGYTIPDEFRQANHRMHFRGSLSMAKSNEDDSGGSQFFLTFVPTSHLDGKHTVFGRVVEGMDLLAKLQRIEPGGPGTPDKIEKAVVVSKRPHKYEVLGKRLDKK
jgi:cyclophilin family peptidyl-prolyl cis-trans isomerase